MRDLDRRTGRTTRMLQEVIVAAAEGEKCMVMAHTWAYAADLRRALLSMLSDDAIESATPLSISLYSGGMIAFAKHPGPRENDPTRGWIGRVFVDHYALEIAK